MSKRSTARSSAPVKAKPKRNGAGPTRDGGHERPVGGRSFARGAQEARRRTNRRRVPGEQPQLRTVVRGWLGRVPRAAWVCALVAFLNAACWSVISPPFEIPDEPSHFAYVQRLAETGKLPTSGVEAFEPAEYAILNDLHYAQVRFHSEHGTISSPSAQHELERDLAKPLARSGGPGATGVSASQPPLYYALETIPYGIGLAGNILDQVELMRLLSALMGGITALFVYLFLLEALPGARWAWTVGSLGVALAPLFAEMSGGINPDAMLYAVSAALFYCLARGFRRGITPRLAAATGAVLAVGMTTKLNFLGLVPGAILGVLVLCAIEAHRSRSSAYRCLALALGVGASPALLYGLVNLSTGGPVSGVFSTLLAFGSHGSNFAEIGYIWQFYLPRLPGMSHDFHGIFTTQVFWFNGLVGLYGWLDAAFPKWVYNVTLIPAGLLAAMFARALIVYRGALASRAVEIAVYMVMGLGLLLLIGVDDYVHKIPGEYNEPRYLLPLLALWGAVLALAARGLGRRWGPLAGVGIVCVVLAHDIFSGLLVISRYYG